MKLMTLMYHDVVRAGRFESSGFPGAAANIYKLEEGVFDAHLRAIAEAAHGVAVGVVSTDGLDDGAVLLTFDDGGATAMAIAERLEAHGWRGYFFITTDYIGRPGFVTEADIRDLHAREHIIGSHSCSHPERMSRCVRDEIDREWRDSARRLSDIIGESAVTGSVPGGFYSPAVAESAGAAGITMLFNSEPTRQVRRVGGCRVVGRFAMERMSPVAAGRLVAGDMAPRVKQAALWQLKKVAKALGGRYWLEARRFILNRRG